MILIIPTTEVLLGVFFSAATRLEYVTANWAQGKFVFDCFQLSLSFHCVCFYQHHIDLSVTLETALVLILQLPVVIDL